MLLDSLAFYFDKLVSQFVETHEVYAALSSGEINFLRKKAGTLLNPMSFSLGMGRAVPFLNRGIKFFSLSAF